MSSGSHGRTDGPHLDKSAHNIRETELYMDHSIEIVENLILLSHRLAGEALVEQFGLASKSRRTAPSVSRR